MSDDDEYIPPAEPISYYERFEKLNRLLYKTEIYSEFLSKHLSFGEKRIHDKVFLWSFSKFNNLE